MTGICAKFIVIFRSLVTTIARRKAHTKAMSFCGILALSRSTMVGFRRVDAAISCEGVSVMIISPYATIDFAKP